MGIAGGGQAIIITAIILLFLFTANYGWGNNYGYGGYNGYNPYDPYAFLLIGKAIMNGWGAGSHYGG